MAAIEIAHAVSVLYVQWWLRSNRPRRINSIDVGYGHDRGRPSHAHIFSSKARIAGEYAKRLSRSSIIFNEYAKRLSRSSISFLVSMPKGFLTLAQLAGECAQGLSRTSTIVWQVCHKGYLADVYGWLASMPKGCLAPACLLASMPKGYLAPASTRTGTSLAPLDISHWAALRQICH